MFRKDNLLSVISYKLLTHSFDVGLKRLEKYGNVIQVLSEKVIKIVPEGTCKNA